MIFKKYRITSFKKSIIVIIIISYLNVNSYKSTYFMMNNNSET